MVNDTATAPGARIAALEAENRALHAKVTQLQGQSDAVAGANAHAAELMVNLEEARDEVAAHNRQLRELLDNVRFGFLTTDRQLRVSAVVTRACGGLLGCEDLPGENLAELLRLDGDRAAFFQFAVEEVFEDFMPEEVLLSQIPARHEVDGRVLKLTATVLRDEDDDIESLLFSIADITRLENEHARNQLMHALLSILRQRGAFQQFICEVDSLLDQGQEAISDGDEVTARRVLHTIKGAGSCYGLRELTEMIHALEEQSMLAADCMEQVSVGIGDFLSQHQDVLRMPYEQARAGVSEYAVTDADLERLSQLSAQRDSAAVEAWICQAREVPVGSIVGPVGALVQQAASRTGKSVRFEFEGDDVRVDRRRLRSILAQVPHLLRNAVAHGVEAPSERGDKPAEGLIRLAVGRDGDGWTITVSDDGAGIDQDALLRTAIEAGAVTREEAERLDGEGILALALCDGISTAAEANQTAGRGVGLSSVAAQVTTAGGTLRCTTERGCGTRFEIRVPAGEKQRAAA